MAKQLAEVIKFPSFPKIIPFPKTQLCGCGCGMKLNEDEDSFIKCGETGKWYTDEYDFLRGVKAVEFNGYYRFLDDNTGYRYTKKEFYEELSAYWHNEYAPIA